jgi:aryl-alcohol dehydrogenase-like predicted oxidoreductase
VLRQEVFGFDPEPWCGRSPTRDGCREPPPGRVDVDYARIEGISVPVSRVVLGTDWFNARRFFWIAGRSFDGAVEAGCTAFDSARAYRDSENILGTWMRARRARDRVVLITKGGLPGPSGRSRLSATEISRDLERSLKALQTDYIDLYLLHYDDVTTDVGMLVELLNQHLEAGRIRAFGVSNWSTARIADASRYATARGMKPPVVSSVQFSLASWRYPPWKNALSISGEGSEADRQWYKTSDVWLLAYSSLAMGFFSSSRRYATGDTGQAQTPPRLGDSVFLDPTNLARLERARQMAERRGVSPGQIALAWVLGFDRRVLAVVGARTAASYVNAAAACGVMLSESDRAWLSRGD